MKRGEELVVITKTYDLILWSCNHTSKFPRNHRFVLGESSVKSDLQFGFDISSVTGHAECFAVSSVPHLHPGCKSPPHQHPDNDPRPSPLSV